MVPLNDHLLVIDLIEHLDAELILVSQNYLGSINHTLLSIEAVQKEISRSRELFLMENLSYLLRNLSSNIPEFQYWAMFLIYL